ncbi:MobF family relaxase [Nocardia sp. alder85J]|uniref:MobF family relaxase n=1 Tax=Nocardia sp. alder85J TaxID=2862949 RepID=UPI001CD2E9A8|nr:MobF family relaxase [Nocardia sp. alder85J]MCX4097714.1 relaxase domain-containing protein [Nocardia sp. alder85J]
MAGNLHKLSAGDGYLYLSRQVAALDASDRGATSLGDYYSAKGEAPGRWMGSGLVAFDTITAGDMVTEEQMHALYGLGRHPDARRIEEEALQTLVGVYLQQYLARGHSMRRAEKMASQRAADEAQKSSRLGTPFKTFQPTQFRQALAAAYSDYNVTRGKPWNHPVPEDVRAGLRTALGLRMFRGHYDRDPLDDRELSSYIARQSRQQTTACAGYDFTLTGVKSGAAFWALAPRPVADVYRQCHDAAVDDTIRRAEQLVAYTRSGTNGVAQIDTQGLIVAVFTHRDSRCGDPQLHSHVVFSNKVRAHDGRWLALDGRPLHRFAVTLSEYFNIRLETHLRNRLGLRFVERPHKDPNKRGTREIVGVDWALCDRWSQRNNDIEARRGELAHAFQAKYGREPSPREAYDLAERAALENRPAKHELRSEAEQRAAWCAEAVEFFGSPAAVYDMIYAALHPGPSEVSAPARHELEAWVEAAADEVIARVSEERATWQLHHVTAETLRLVRAAELDPADVDPVTDAVAAAALAPSRCFALPVPDLFHEPPGLTRHDGSSVFVPVGTQSYSSAPVMAAEQRILDAAGRRDGQQVSAMAVDLALLEYAANAPDKPLNPDQIAMIRGFSTSGGRVEVTLAPAGTGKTTALGVFARAWRNDGGTVLGLAPTANAAAVLRDQIGGTCDTIAKLLDSLDRSAAAAESGRAVRIPQWVNDIGPSTVVIVDEAALASTAQLDRVVAFVLGRGGSVKLAADDRQLAAISAGGIVRAIVDEYDAYRLGRVIRFRDEHGNTRTDEAAASLALRDGDPSAIAFYLDGRIHSGDPAALADRAYSAWATDRRAGLDAVMLAPTHEITRSLNVRARADRLTVWGTTGPEVVLRDDTRASAGDIVRTTQNDRRLALSGTDWVRNGDRWSVDTVHADGALSVTHLRTSLAVTLPAEYVTEHVILGYASTIMTSQGITADSGYTVLSGNETRNDIYMAATRGSLTNHLYVPTAQTGDEQSIVTDKAMHPQTAAELLTRVLARDGAQKAVVTLISELHDPRTRLAAAVDAYVHALGTAAETLLGTEELAHLERTADTVVAGVTDAAAWPTLRQHLAILALCGIEPIPALTRVRNQRELGTARDVAAVLDWRLTATVTRATGSGPLPWMTGIPDPIADDPHFGSYLAARAALVSELAARIAADAVAWTPANAPGWARPLLSADATTLIADVAVWRAATAVPTVDPRPTGPDRMFAREISHQQRLDDRVATILGDPTRAAARWAALADRLDTRLVDDAYWPVLADRLTATARTGLDAAELFESVVTAYPLPDELPAAAVWWRLTRHLDPALLEHLDGEMPPHVQPEPLSDSDIPPESDTVPTSSADSDRPVSTLAPDELDEDYLSAVLAHAPDEPADASPQPRSGVDDAEILIDFDITGPAPIVPYPEATSDERVKRLRADLAAARQRTKDLWAIHLAGAGQHRRAADPMVIAMRHQADVQAPFRVAALDAHRAWQDADRAATAAEHAHATAVHAAATARPAGAGAESAPDEPTVAILAMEAAAARSRADDAKNAADHAQRAWENHAGDQGMVTPGDVDALRIAADDMDSDVVAAAHADKELLEGQLLRAESAAARRTESEPGISPKTIVVRTPAPQPRPPQSTTTGGRLQMMPDSELETEITRLADAIHRMRQTSAPGSDLSPTAVADETRRDHRRLHTQGPIVAAALETEQNTRDTETRWHQARADLVALTHRRNTNAVRGKAARHQLDDDIATATSRVAAFHAEHVQARAALRTATDAAIALGAYPDQWAHITSRIADAGALQADLQRAITEDAERTHRQNEHRIELDQQLAQLQADLDATVTEQRRRAVPTNGGHDSETPRETGDDSIGDIWPDEENDTRTTQLDAATDRSIHVRVRPNDALRGPRGPRA